MSPLWEWDQAIFRAIHIGLHRDWLDPVFWLITTTGLGWIQAILILLIPLAADLRHELRRRPFIQAVLSVWRNPVFAVWPLLVTTAVSGLFFAQGIKRAIAARDRPSLLNYAHPQEDILYNSFPSGHSTTAFAIAFMLFFLTWRTDRAWVGRYALIWATLVGISRIYRGVHWPTDVLGGLFAGLLSSTVVYWITVVLPNSKQPGPESSVSSNQQ
ncbi:MAG TPA: phosphatase PAP2 family protein [Fimbriimonadaceae bacterium]|nr:phosphatase PAP2 family protein [Fimbriimonadaceae bacterium]